MKTTVTIDDELYAKALEMTDADIEPSELIEEALRTFIRVNAASRLANLGGTAPKIQDIPRRNS